MASRTASTADNGLTLEDRRAFMRLPLDQRRRQLAEQVDRVLVQYETPEAEKERRQWQVGDIVDY